MKLTSKFGRVYLSQLAISNGIELSGPFYYGKTTLFNRKSNKN